MSEFRLATRYAKSLIELAMEKNQLTEVNNDIRFLQAIIKSSGPFRALLKNPIVNADIKNKIIALVLDQKVATITSTFITLLVNKRREEYLSAVINEFINQYNEHKNITPVYFTTAVPVDQSVLDKLRELFIKRSGVSDIELNTKIDPNIVGGFIFRFQDRLYDASIRRQLEQVDDQFVSNPYFGKFLLSKFR